MPFFEGVGVVWAGVLAACTVLNAAAALLLARASLPRRLESRLEALSDQIEGYDRRLLEYERTHQANESLLRGLIEEAENGFARAERKRASAAATLSRMQPDHQVEPRTRSELINMLRRRDAG